MTTGSPDEPLAGRGDKRPSFASFTAMVVEDNMLIAMDAEETLQELGASMVQSCSTVAHALACLAATRFDIALLDVNLGSETSEAVAGALQACGTPFIVSTGLGDSIGAIAAFAGVPLLYKPYTSSSLLKALEQIGVSRIRR